MSDEVGKTYVDRIREGKGYQHPTRLKRGSLWDPFEVTDKALQEQCADAYRTLYLHATGWLPERNAVIPALVENVGGRKEPAGDDEQAAVPQDTVGGGPELVPDGQGEGQVAGGVRGTDGRRARTPRRQSASRIRGT